MATLSSVIPPVNISSASGTLPVASGGTGLTSPGTAGNVLSSNGTSWISQAVSSASVQTFSSSGTWTKPSGANFVLVEVWGAGGGGSRPAVSVSNSSYSAGGGGGGGSYNFELFVASTLGATETVIIGAGGVGGATTGASGTAGGATNFGSKIYAYGGGGGTDTLGGGGGGVLAASSGNAGGSPLIGTTATQNMGGAYGGSSTTTTGGLSVYGGGGGGGGGALTTVSTTGGDSAYGGGGGGGSLTYKVIGGGTNITSFGSGQGGIGGTGVSSQNPKSFFGSNGDFRGGGAGSALYDFPNFAMSQFNSSGVIANANNGAQVVVLGSAQFVPFLFVSADGTSTYTPYPLPLGYQTTLYNIFYDGTKYVIIVSGSVLITTDFINFTYGVFPNTSTVGFSVGSVNFVKYANGYYFICSNQDAYYSNNLSTWTRANVNGGANADIGGVTYDGTYYYAVRTNGTVYRSTDLSTWAGVASGAVSNSYYVAASPTAVVVGAQGAPYLRISTDQGLTWANTTTAFATAIVSMNYIPSQSRWFLGTNTPELFTSTDGTNWVTANLTVSRTQNVVHNGTVFVAAARTSSTAQVGQTATVATGAWTGRTTSGFQTTIGKAGGDGGIAGGGGGGGGGALTTTGNGGNGGAGYCRVYTW